jgi:hypothetical protein
MATPTGRRLGRLAVKLLVLDLLVSALVVTFAALKNVG